MTDSGRKDLSDSECSLPSHPLTRTDFIPELQDKATPDSSKSTMDKVGDTVTGVGDKAQRYASLSSPAYAH